MENALHDEMVAILSRCSDLAISTVRSDGLPQTKIVSYVNDGDRVYFGCWARSQKARNIAACDKVSYAVHNNVRDWDKIQAVHVGGRAVRVDQPAEMARFKTMMLEKFPQIENVFEGNALEMAIFRVDPIAASVLDYAKALGNTEAVRLPVQT